MSKADRQLAGLRRVQVAQAALTQGILVLILLAMAFLNRREPRTALMSLAFAIVPAAWGLAIWDAQKRDAAARAAGTWSRASDDRLKKRTYAILAGSAVAAVALAALVWLFV